MWAFNNEGDAFTLAKFSGAAPRSGFPTYRSDYKCDSFRVTHTLT
jgi:hypothetical protein